MGGIVNKAVEVSSFGLIDDVTGQKAAGEAAKEAGRLQADAAARAEAGIDARYQDVKGMLQPHIESSRQASNQYQKLLGLNGDRAQRVAYRNIKESPAQKFIRNRQEKAILQNAAALGGIGGGNVRTALQEQAAGFAMQDVDNQFNRLSGLMNNGAAQSLAGYGMNAANASGNAIMNQGQAIAGGVLGQAQADAQATGQVMQLAGTAIGAFAGGAPGAALGGQAGSAMAPQVTMPQGTVMSRNPLTLY